jgi:uncharacterized protein (TIGR00304 family)
MRRSGWVPIGLLALGIVLIVDAVIRGSATVTVVAIVPVLTGSSVEFLAGVVCLLIGFLSLPFAFYSLELAPDSELDARPHGETPPEEVGGVLLVGPIPIFFGSWKSAPLRTKVAVGVVGAIVLIALLAWVVLR